MKYRFRPELTQRELEEFLNQVHEVRVVQKEFFKTRNRDLIPVAKSAETKLDHMLQKLTFFNPDGSTLL